METTHAVKVVPVLGRRLPVPTAMLEDMGSV